ncbi:hypothetical protein [Nitrosospira sp. Nsp1]|uniref:hypothetical protein n=1 Tax=Nitrosospira sp. Nsp1 TaxID=136547 RepID=UPI000882FA77|nr:hypothetical protein [Nitrosospira sp. Nsp1]SCX40498.1 hypothetical protein SAMN05720354_103119 [Nitrosospira sp. Nsp1]
MPPVIFAAAAWFAAATAFEIAVMAISVSLTIGTTVFGAVQQQAAAKKAKRAAARAREDFLNSLQERTVTRIATYAPHRYIYGRDKVGSDVVEVLISGANDEYKHLICIHAAHECDAIEEVYVDGKALGPLDDEGFVTEGDYFISVRTENVSETFATSPFTMSHTPSSAVRVIASGRIMSAGGQPLAYPPRGGEVSFTRVGNTLTVTSAPASPVPGTWLQVTGYTVTYQHQINSSQVRVRKHLGIPGDPADASLLAECGEKWKATATLTGFCYTVIRLDLRQPAFQGGLPNVEVLVRGKKLYDPRTGLTVWSENPPLCIYDYLTSEICGVPASDLPVAHYITAANACDEEQSFGKLYTCNGAVTADEDQAKILEAMADSMAGGIVAMTWEIFAGKYIAPIAALQQTDIVGALAVTPGISDADIINGTRGQFVSAENDYVPTDYAPYQNSAYLAADGREKWGDITYPFTNTTQRVHNLARIETEDQRNGFTVKAEFSLKAWDLRIGDRVTLTSAFLGQTDKVYRISDKKYAPDSAIELTLKEDAASIWDVADTITLDDTPNTNLPNPFHIAPLGYVTLDSGTGALITQQDGTIVSRIKATWEAATGDVASSGFIEIEWQDQRDIAWRKTSTTGSETSTYLSPVEDSAWYVVRARAVNPYLNVRSDWTYGDLHKVVGKSEPPGDITDLAIDGSILSWTVVTDLDLDGYIFRFHYGANTDWGTAAPLHKGVATSSPFDLITLPYGAVTILGKALDTSGNESLNAALIFTNLGDAPVANVVASTAFEPTFAGTLENCTVIGGELVADSTSSFYGDPAALFYGPPDDPVYKADSYAKMIYTTNAVTVSSVLAGSAITLSLTTQGNNLIAEYKAGTGAWLPWPGQITAQADNYQFRVTVGYGATQGKIIYMAMVIDAPDIEERISDLTVSSSGTAIPYSKDFTAIQVINVTLQENGSGGVSAKTDKTLPLAPSIKVYNSAGAAVSGAKVDIILQGY